MMGKDRNFTVGDFVFAKVRGFPAWPARIQSVIDPRPSTLKYNVFFFGTSETACVVAKDIFYYVENKDRLGKPIKRKFFNEGIEELEEELKKVAAGGTSSKGLAVAANGKREEPAKIRRPKKSIGEENEAPNTSVDDKAPDPKLTKRKMQNDDGPAKKKKKLGTPAVNTKDENDFEDDVNDSNNTEDLKEPAFARETPTLTNKKKGQNDSADLCAHSKEQVSRSGRVIKPKKFLYDGEVEDEEKQKAGPSADPENEKEEVKEPVLKKVRKSKPSKEIVLPPISPPHPSSMGRIMWARTKGGQLVQVKLDRDRPSSFKDGRARITWEKNYEQQMKSIKEKIESGDEDLPEEIKVQIKPTPEVLLNMTDEEVSAKKKQRVCERKKGKLRWLKLETRLVDIDVLLKTCLGKTKADTDKALSLMDELMTLPIDPLMLKKHPQLVDTIKKIRNYAGNIGNWDMKAEEISAFKSKASKIREKAHMILNKFRALFAVPKSDDFWDIFVNSVQEFNNLTKDLPRTRVHSLTVDPTSPYYQEVTEFDNEEEEFGKEIMKSVTTLCDSTTNDS